MEKLKQNKLFSATVLVLSFLLLAVCLCNTNSVNADAASGDCGATDSDSVRWSFDSGTGELNITGSGAMKDFGVMYNKTQAPWGGYYKDIRTVMIGDKVTAIGAYAFYNTSIETLSIGNKVKNIANSAFTNCDKLKEITIPDSVTNIGRDAFYDCDGFTRLVIPDSVKSIGEAAFARCSSLESVSIGNGITVIEYDTFFYCAELSIVTLGSRITDIGKTAFKDCAKIKSIAIPDSVKVIRESAFAYTSLENITLPDSVVYIGDGAFQYTDYYDESSNWENGVLYIGKHLISVKSSLSGAYSVKEGTLVIAAYAFNPCDAAVTEIVIPESVVSINDHAFYMCSSLSSIYIPKGVRSIGADAFANCFSLTRVEFENPNDWWVTDDLYGTSGAAVDVSEPQKAAESLMGDYCGYYWNQGTAIIGDNTPDGDEPPGGIGIPDNDGNQTGEGKPDSGSGTGKKKGCGGADAASLFITVLVPILGLAVVKRVFVV